MFQLRFVVSNFFTHRATRSIHTKHDSRGLVRTIKIYRRHYRKNGAKSTANQSRAISTTVPRRNPTMLLMACVPKREMDTPSHISHPPHRFHLFHCPPDTTHQHTVETKRSKLHSFDNYIPHRYHFGCSMGWVCVCEVQLLWGGWGGG